MSPQNQDTKPEPRGDEDNTGQDSGAGEMTFLEHLDELRGVIIKSVVVLLVCIMTLMSGLKYFAAILNWPMEFAMGDRQTLVDGLITSGPMGVFSVVLQISFLGGFALALPFILYFIAGFILPGLTVKEKAILTPACIGAFVLFFTGAVFSYGILVPAALKAAIFFNELLGFEIIWSADKYYGTLVWMVLGVGVSFEFPLVIVALVHLGMLTSQQMKEYRPHAMIAFLGLAAVVTPTTDPFTFLLLALPMALLYEISLRIARRIEARKAEPEDTGNA